MRELFGRLGKQTLVYGVGGAGIQLVGLITLPIYARVFSPAEYGVLEVATVGSALLMTLVDSGMTSAAQRSFYDYSDEQGPQRRAALATALATMLALSLLVTATLVVFATPISHLLFTTRAHADLVRIVGFSVPIVTIAAYMREVMRLRFRAWSYVSSATIGALGTAAAGITAVKAFDAGISGVLLGLLIGNGIAAVYGLAVAHREIAARLSRLELRRMLRYGAPLIPAAFAMWGLSFLDRIMLSRLGSFADTGEYAVGSRFSSLLMFGMATFMTAYIPFMLALWQEESDTERELRARLLTYVTVVFVGAGLCISLFARELTTVIAPRFDRSYTIVGILCAGVVFYTVGSVASAGIGITRQTKYIGAYTVVAVVLNVALNFLLIPGWGMVGAAVAVTCSYAVLAFLYYRKGQQLYHTPYVARHTLTALLVGCPLMAVGAVPIEPLGLALVVKLAALGAFVLTVWRGRMITEEEFAAVLSLSRRVRVRRAAATPSP